ncbi:CBS domain-containing protein [Desulfosarcina sp.]|uniref:CBS domain-containing protein n=1 Tax=Desulfosarcina sp. TaxID=2027861 RepID=UPI0029A63D64|nr:CBS domain-containing protein [Desulfosarcina sp.]MDX2455587.1 CBS domain-containing protein [Desulfosarcina sp.]MDX2493073.1 CBS domain-containing protein [Desulfosarcina sp.]
MEIVATHKGTDFDALASVVAAHLLYPGSICVLPEPQNPNVRSFISLHKNLFNVSRPKDLDVNRVTRLIVVDTCSWSRLGGLNQLENKKDLEIHLFDHHGNEGDLDPIWQCQDTVGANITLMLRHLRKRQNEITPIHASLFLAGLYEDTGNLTFPSTTAEDAHAAAFFLERGADLKILTAFISPAYSQKQKKLLFRMLQTAQRTKLNGRLVSIIQLQVDGHVENLALVVQMARQVWNVEAAQLMVKHDIGRLPVVEDGQLVGIITRSDAMGHFYGLCPLNGHLDPAGIRN